MTVEAAKRGYAFAVVRPRGDRNFETKTINLVFVVEEGARAYIERINIRGNTRTRDYVIRREFDLGEGDAYNRALIDRAERRLKNLGYFKTVKITNEPGSAPDRVVINVDVEEQATGEFSISGGYSTADGFIAEVSVAERNLFGRGNYGKASVHLRPMFAALIFRSSSLSCSAIAWPAASTFSRRQNLAPTMCPTTARPIGTNLRLGFALTEEIAFQPRYSILSAEDYAADQYNDCQFSSNALHQWWARRNAANEPVLASGDTIVNPPFGCYANGEASLAVRNELAAGPREPVAGWLYGFATTRSITTRFRPAASMPNFKQDFAGVGGDVNFIRTSVEARNYYEVFSDIVSVLKVQAGNSRAWGGEQLRMLDHFQMGPNLVRGFSHRRYRTARLDPRHD